MISIGYDMVYHKQVEHFVYEKSLKEVQFPLAIKLCLFRYKNYDAGFEKLGYEDVTSFYKGISKFPGNWTGWNGHTENGSTVAPVEGIFVMTYLDKA